MKKRKFRYNIVVSGASKIKGCEWGTKKKATEIGKYIAQNDCALVSGATTGASYYAAVGSRNAGGFNIGFSPAASRSAHAKTFKLPLEPFDLMVYTGADYAGRDIIMTKGADAVIIICGRTGTMHEFLTAVETRKIIGILEGTGGAADHVRELLREFKKQPKAPLIYETDPKLLIEKVIEKIEKKFK